MPDTLRIAHCSDIHLDGEVYGRRAAAGSVAYFRNAFASALADMGGHRPDLMLLAGDLFDSNGASTETIQWAMDMLARQPFPIVMIPGNHDSLAEDAIYRCHDFNRIPNVRLLTAETGETVYLPELGVAVWGKGMVEHTPVFSPLGGCPGRPVDCRWYLGLGHGLFVPEDERSFRASPIHRREVEASPCDYLALGHHHAAMALVTANAAAAYSGSPTDDVGGSETYVICELVDGCVPTVTVHTVGKGG
jgi:DNA repair exonuclease SbcCD nuclease subunit